MNATKCPACENIQYFNPCGCVVQICESCRHVFRGDHNRIADRIAPYGYRATRQELEARGVGPIEAFVLRE